MTRIPSWKEMSPEEKKQYFRDYYLYKVLIAAAVLVFLAVLIHDLTKPKPQYALRIGIYDAALSKEEKTELEQQIQAVIRTSDPVELDDAYSSFNDEDLLRIAASSTNGCLDILIAEKDTFEWLAGYGYFRDLSDTGIPQEQILVCRGLAVSEDGLLKENAEGTGDPYAAGVLLEGTMLGDSLKQLSSPVMGIIYESGHFEEAMELARR